MGCRGSEVRILSPRPISPVIRTPSLSFETMSGCILVVEDEPITQALLAASLERAGHQVLRAASVAEAQATIRDTLPDMVLLDWILPETTGVSFARQLRADQRT